MIRTSSYSWQTPALGPHLLTLRAAIAGQTGTPQATPYRVGPAHGHDVATSTAYMGAVVEPNFDQVVLVPSSRATVDTYDPATEALLLGPAHGESTPAFSGGTLVNSRMVVMTPVNAAHVGLYDPLTRTYSAGPTHDAGVTGAFTGAALTASGLVVMAPAASPKIGIFNPVTGKFRLGPNSPLASGFTGVQALDGDWVLMVPAGAQLPYLYNASTDELTPAGATALSSTRGLTMLQDGRVVFTPHNLSRFGIYDRQKNSTTLMATAVSSNTAKFWGSALTGNGEVVAPPYSYGSIAVFTPGSLAYAAGQAIAGTAMFAGAIALTNGDILFVPARSPNIGLYRHLSGGKSLPREVLLSRFYNKAF